ncbi:uncharacterized protein LOC124920055 [Impatiens glandulifera]|uniref:uncharacterized protein LOC124920055 n=1 Tax=Impatiens glandulifera TaxID=253017 RepID=UPI001FB0E4C7|nr:uncharacterized protein LOC124920055 [Impatiens glandulifera]
MERSGIYAVILLLLYFCCDLSSAWSFRNLIDTGSKENPPTKNVSPLPSPVSNGNQTNTTSADGDKPIPKPIKDTPIVDQDPKLTNQTVNSTETHATPEPTIDEKENNNNNKDKGNTPSSGSGESCNDQTKSCKSGAMVACLQGLDNGTKHIVIMIQNEGEVTLKVKVKQPTSEHTINPVTVDGHQTGKIDIPMSNDETIQKVILDAGNGDCELINNGGVPETRKEELLQQLQFYYEQMTPIYGAYMFFAVAMIVGGIWSCCKFIRKRRQEGGIAYQELEMAALPETDSNVAVGSVAAAGDWDEDWDDDWDEENAVKSPVVSISSNGLTARSSNRNGWEKDWDD